MLSTHEENSLQTIKQTPQTLLPKFEQPLYPMGWAGRAGELLQREVQGRGQREGVWGFDVSFSSNQHGPDLKH